AAALIAAQEAQVAGVAARLARGENVGERLRVLQAEVEALPRERMDHVRRVAEQRDARPHQALRAQARRRPLHGKAHPRKAPSRSPPATRAATTPSTPARREAAAARAPARPGTTGRRCRGAASRNGSWPPPPSARSS